MFALNMNISFLWKTENGLGFFLKTIIFAILRENSQISWFKVKILRIRINSSMSLQLAPLSSVEKYSNNLKQ